jgi:hypothetical protein
MAGFHTKTFKKFDDYMTPFSAWRDIYHLIPKDKIIWESFYCDGESGTHLQKLGFNVIHENIDFFENDKGDIVVSNPPFTLIPEILARLVELNKPFIMIMPSSKINTQYFRKLFCDNDDKIQIIIPKKRIQFIKIKNGIKTTNKDDMKCNFDCFYYCWRMNLSSDIIWLDDEPPALSKKKIVIKKK